MRIKTANKAGVSVENNFSISYQEATQVSTKINSWFKKTHQNKKVSPSGIYTISLLGQIYKYIIDNHLKKKDADVFLRTRAHTYKKMPTVEVEKTVDLFSMNFLIKGDPIEEILILRLTNENPACIPYSVVFDEEELISETSYLDVAQICYDYLRTFRGPGKGSLDIIDFLKSPSTAHPYSLQDQLGYIAEYWKPLLGNFLSHVLRGLDYLKEENKPVFPAGPGPIEPYSYDYTGFSPEGFSSDSSWMPNVIMMAKSTLVWLDQLSKQYESSIQRLDQIPDNELDILSSRGFTALWLIGLWDRSSASKQIKRTCGNPEAESSAYSLKGYQISPELGGWQSLENLKIRCEQRGIRLASDMVPNHTGIDSDWVIEHPDWFLQLPEAPYPNYSFQGQNLSPHPDTGIYLEDHYYDRTDAAVCFKRVDFRNSKEQYIYHGNDGTSMPWNDTAQLNFLDAEVREAIIQTILQVAKNFPIIRFDAAMTLAKKHIQRLWFPEPGSGGDIPTRSEKGLSRAEFDKLMPVEFWREVVDRLKIEAPDTLLLAEAFWMMEGYFVKNLGMHRVYNSAFMNMLKMEENRKYKDTIKNTISHDPEILKRFVNFMNNPDEDSAADQFGVGDKYFGICTMLITMPGLPMFGHGQVEGFREKYGMEYRKAYWNEVFDYDFLQRHKKEIFPILKLRYLFSESANFNLFDMFSNTGQVNDNVFAWSNFRNKMHTLVIYNNNHIQAEGWINTGAPKLNQPEISLADALGLKNDSTYYCIFTEHKSNLSYIRNSKKLYDNGLYLNLKGYESHVFMNFREVSGNLDQWERLEEYLNGEGTFDIDRSMARMLLSPASECLSKIFQPEYTSWIRMFVTGENDIGPELAKKLSRLYSQFLSELEKASYADRDSNLKAEAIFAQNLKALENIRELTMTSQEKPRWFEYIFRGFGMMPEVWSIMTAWLVLYPLKELNCKPETEKQLFSTCLITLLEDLNAPGILENVILHAGIQESAIPHLHKLVLLVSTCQNGIINEERSERTQSVELRDYFNEQIVSEFIGRNLSDGIEWFNRESFQLIVWWIFTLQVLKIADTNSDSDYIERIFTIIRGWLKKEEYSDCRVERMISGANK